MRYERDIPARTRWRCFLSIVAGLALLACNDDPSAPFGNPTPESPTCADYTSLYEGWNSLPLPTFAVALEVTDAEILLATRDSTLHVLSLPGAGLPSFLDSERLDCVIRDVAAGTGFVAVACYVDGLALFQLEANGDLIPRTPWVDGSPVTEVEASDSTLVAIGGGLLRVLHVDASGQAQLLGVEAVSTEASRLRWQDPVAAIEPAFGAGIQLFSLEDPTDPAPADAVVASTLRDYEMGAKFLAHSFCPDRGGNGAALRDISHPFATSYLGATFFGDDCVRSVHFDAGRFYLEYDGQYPFRHDIYEFEPLQIPSWSWSSITPMVDYPPLIEVRNGTVYSAGNALGWAGLDRPAASTALGVWPHNGGLDWMGFRDDVLFGVSVNWGLEAIDISDPSDLRELGRVRANTSSRGLQVGSRYVLFGNVSKLVTVDALDPTAMIWVNELELDFFIYEIGARGPVLYVDQEENGISIVDATTPTSPIEVDRIDAVLSKSSMRVFDDFMVLLSKSDGVPAAAISDISDPLNPTAFKSFGGTDALWSDAIYDLSTTTLFLVGAELGIIAYDVTDRLAPAYVTQFTGVPEPYRAAISGHQLFVLNSEALVVLDVANPASIKEIGRLPVRNMTNVETNGAAVFLAKWNDALRSFRMACQD